MTTPNKAPETTFRINSVGRGINILLAIARSSDGLSASELSTQLGIGRQTTYHLLHTLSAVGMVKKSDNKKYILGLGIGELARGFERQFSVPGHLQTAVEGLAQHSGETTYSAGWWHGEIVTLSVARGTQVVRVSDVPQGQYEHAHARATGKLLLAMAPSRQLLAHLSTHPLTKLTDQTIVDLIEFQDELARIRSQGFAVDKGEFAKNVSCLAVPMGGKDAPFALALSAPAERFAENFDQYLELALTISRER